MCSKLIDEENGKNKQASKECTCVCTPPLRAFTAAAAVKLVLVVLFLCVLNLTSNFSIAQLWRDRELFADLVGSDRNLDLDSMKIAAMMMMMRTEMDLKIFGLEK